MAAAACCVLLMMAFLAGAGASPQLTTDNRRWRRQVHTTQNSVSRQHTSGKFIPSDTREEMSNQLSRNRIYDVKSERDLPDIDAQLKIQNEVSDKLSKEDALQAWGTDLGSDGDTFVAEDRDMDNENVNKWSNCIYESDFLTCLKHALLSAVDDFVVRWGRSTSPYNLINGFVTLERSDNISESGIYKVSSTNASLDSKIVEGLNKIFRHRTMKISFLPGLSVRILPDEDSPALVKLAVSFDGEIITGRKKSGGMGMMTWMLVPTMISLGLLPFTLASLKMMVMTGVTLNNFALSSAVFTAVRNIVFGPRPGGNVVYRNDGYRNEEKHHSNHQHQHPYRGHYPAHIVLVKTHDK